MASFINIPCEKKPPTQKHRPALWEAMLGTVYAYDGREVKYFDYDWERAIKFAKVPTDGTDCRLAKKKRNVTYTGSLDEPSVGKLILWIKEK